MSTATLVRESRRKKTPPSVTKLRFSRHPVQLADFPTREHPLLVGKSLMYRQGRTIIVNDAPGDLFNQRADVGLV